ncbi:hypothetical protein B0H11DRAFT_1925015 [Mycena galericulata]|nr:hypothetical protein B0H11DRAFT_1925015 [Mycena galericulata]
MAATTNGVAPFTGPCHCYNDVGGGEPFSTDGWCTQGSDMVGLGCDATNTVQCFYTSVTDFGSDHCNCTLRATLADCEDICLTAGGANVDQFCEQRGFSAAASSPVNGGPSAPESTTPATSSNSSGGEEARPAWKLMAGLAVLILTGALLS